MLFAGNKLVSFALYDGKLYRVSDKYFGKSTQIEVSVPSENGSMNAGISKVFLLESLGDGEHQVTIDWGDSVSTTYTIDGIESHEIFHHQYLSPGKYIVSIPPAVEKIGFSSEDTSFDNKINPTAFINIIKFSKNLKTLLPYCFRGSRIKVFDFSKSYIEDIQDSCIRKSNYAEKVIVGKNVKNIGKNAIAENSRLKEVIFEEDNQVSSFGSMSFSENHSLTSIIGLPAAVQESSKGQFQKSFQLLKENSDDIFAIDASIPSGWTSIPSGLFKGCTHLDFVSIPSTVSCIYEGAFSDDNVMSYDGYSPLVNGLKSLYITGHQLSDLNNLESNSPLLLKKEDGRKALLNDVFSKSGSTDDIFLDEKTISECCEDQKSAEIMKNTIVRPEVYLTFDTSAKDRIQKKSFFYIKHTPKATQLDWSRYAAKNEIIAFRKDENVITADSAIFSANLQTQRIQAFDDVEEVTQWSCISAYIDESSKIDGADENGKGVFYTWNPDPQPTKIFYMDGTSEEILHGQIFKSSDLPAEKASEIVRIEFGKYSTVIIDQSSLTSAVNLEKVYIPSTVDVIKKKAFSGLKNLKTIEFENIYGCTFEDEAFTRSGLENVVSKNGSRKQFIFNENVQFESLRDQTSHKAFYNCKSFSTPIEMRNTVEISYKSMLSKTAVEFLSYPNAEKFSTSSTAFEEMESLKYVRLPKLTAFNSDYLFDIIQEDHDIILDFTDKNDDIIPSVSEKAFWRNETDQFKNFKILVSEELYSRWESDSRWSEYSGKLIPANPEWSDMMSFSPLPEFIEEFGFNQDFVVFSMKKMSTDIYSINGHEFVKDIADEKYKSEKYGEFKIKNSLNAKISIGDYILLKYVHRNIIPQHFRSEGLCTTIIHQDGKVTKLKHNGNLTKGIVSQIDKIGGGIRKVSLVDAIDVIDDESFMSNKTLELMSSGTLVQKIGKRAFKGCINLKTASLGNCLKSISEEMMSGCTSLEHVYLSGPFNGDDNEIGEKAFKGCSSLRTFKVPENLKQIGPQMFCNCLSLENIQIGNSVEWIWKEAFSGCGSLSRIHLPASLKGFITNDKNGSLCIFKECGNLSEVFFDGIQKIPEIVYSELQSSDLFTDSFLPNWISLNDFAFYVPKKLWDRWIFMPQWKDMKDRIRPL